MPSFTITPVNVEAAVGDVFPNFIQFQFNGENLGGPDADTVNFSTGLTATRGTGESANVVTLVAAPALVVTLVGATPAAMNAAVFSDWTGTSVVTSTDAEWSQADQAIKFLTAGAYEVAIAGRAVRGDIGAWPINETFVGSAIDEDVNIPKTQYARDDLNISAGQSFMAWSDWFVVNATANQLVQPKVYSDSYLSPSTSVDYLGRVVVRRLGAVV